MPRVVVLTDRCKSCGLCVDVCPKEILAIGDKPNPKGYYPVGVTDETECQGCGLCGLVCPDLVLEVYK